MDLSTEEAVLTNAIYLAGSGTYTAAAKEAVAVYAELQRMDWKLVDLRVPLPDVAHARRSDPATSEIAAASIDNMKERHRAVLQVARSFHEPYTYDDLIRRYNHRRDDGYRVGTPGAVFVEDLPKMSESSIRSRAKALCRAGWIVDTGERGLSDAGGSAILWKAVR